MTARRHQRWWQWDFLLPLGLALLLVGCAARTLPPTEAQQRLTKARALFAERCKTAGEKIYKTVDNVEGIFLMKLRPQEVNFGAQFEMNDPYGDDFQGDAYIASFLKGHAYASLKNAPPEFQLKGYLFVDATDPQDGQRYRYTGGRKDVVRTTSRFGGGDGVTKFISNEYALDKAFPNGPAPRYGVTYDDISTQEEREFWIAGSSLRVIDMNTGEVMAERIGYMMDTGQGNRGGGRSPWLFAADHSCPAFAEPGRNGSFHQTWQTDRFVEKVLKPTGGTKNVD